jgi:uncharacterized protein YwgA
MASSPNMKRRDLILELVALCQDREEFGRTSLQKTAFFVSERFGTELGHRAHFYGPFSDQVEADIEALVVAGLINEKTSGLGFVSHGGREARRYEYSLTSDGAERIATLQKTYPEEVAKLRGFVARLAEAAGGLDQRILSPAAKTYFIAKRERRPMSTGEIREIGKSLGWDLRAPQIKQVASVLSSIGLAKVASTST